MRLSAASKIYKRDIALWETRRVAINDAFYDFSKPIGLVCMIWDIRTGHKNIIRDSGAGWMRLWQMIYEIYSVGRLIDMTHEMT